MEVYPKSSSTQAQLLNQAVIVLVAALRGAEGEVARGEFAVESNGAVEVSGSGPSSPMLISSYAGAGNVVWPVTVN